MAYLPAFVVDFYRKNVGIPWYTIIHGSYGLKTQPAIFSFELCYKGLTSRKVVRVYLRCHLRITYAATAPAYA